MAGYMVLGKYTTKALQNLKDMPEIIEKHRQHCKEQGIRLIGTWLTLGEYDFVSIYDAPDDLGMAARILETSQNGLVTTQTMRAFSEDEFKQILAKLP